MNDTTPSQIRLHLDPADRTTAERIAKADAGIAVHDAHDASFGGTE